MKCLCLLQPWASLMAYDLKRVETRSWKYPGQTPVRVAIHAGKQPFTVKEAEAFCYGVDKRHWRHALTRHLGFQDGTLCGASQLPYGCIVAVGMLRECRPTAMVRESLLTEGGDGDLAELAFGDYSAGRWAWLFEDLERLKTPVPCRGFQGVWSLAPEIVEKVEMQLTRLAEEKR